MDGGKVTTLDVSLKVLREEWGEEEGGGESVQIFLCPVLSGEPRCPTARVTRECARGMSGGT